MYKLLFFVSLLVITSCTGKSTKQDKSFSDSDILVGGTKSREDSLRDYLKINDSIKIIEMTGDWNGNYAVFIDYNHKSDLYNSFEYLKKPNTDSTQKAYTSWVLGQYQSTTSKQVCKRIKSEFQYLLGSWMDIESYRNELYAVVACEFSKNFILTDSLFYRRYMDGLHPFVIDTIKSISPSNVQLTIRDESNKIMNINFILVDRLRSTYIVQEDLYRDRRESHYMTKVAFARKYDLIYHVCENEVDGMVFDDVNYDEIVRKDKK